MTDRQKALVSVFVGALLTGATAAVTKIGLVDIPQFSFVFVRFLIASIVLLPFINTKTIIKDSIKIFPLSIFFIVNILVFILGVKITTATISQFLYTGVPIITTLILFLGFKEKIKQSQVIGVLTGFIGVAILVLLPKLEGQQFSGNLIGNLFITIGVISYSFFMVYSRKVLNNFSPFTITASITFITTIVAFPLFIFESLNNFTWWSTISLNSFAALMYVAIVSTIIVYLFNQYAIKHGGSILASTTLYLSPVVGFFAAYVLLGEQLTQGVIAGGVLALLGIYLVAKK